MMNAMTNTTVKAVPPMVATSLVKKLSTAVMSSVRKISDRPIGK